MSINNGEISAKIVHIFEKGMFWSLGSFYQSREHTHKGPLINYISVPREGQTHSYIIFSKLIFYIRNCRVKCFGRDHISFASGR